MKALSCVIPLLVVLIWPPHVSSQESSAARHWNDALLEAIRTDFARPTIHARNLFHISAAMYDAWTVFDGQSSPYFLGKTVRQFTCPFDGFSAAGDPLVARDQAISFAAYRLLTHRFSNSPGQEGSQARFDSLMSAFEYDVTNTSVIYQTGDGAALGNYIAACIIDFGLQDDSNELRRYSNLYYTPYNDAMIPAMPGNPSIFDPNRWQPLSLDFVDQAGNPIPVRVPLFLSPEWGKVSPFALTSDDLTIYERDNNEYWVYHDPGPPPLMEEDGHSGFSEEYAWGFSLVALWSSHLDPTSGPMIDISPASIGNLDIESFPRTIEGLRSFFNDTEGGDPGTGYDLNPVTGEPYESQMVPLGDYARVLAEFWADGPDSETPPGHWYTILNYVSDHPEFEKRYKGEGDVLDNLEWDVKAYFALGGAVHDAAVAAWGIKGWYDYVRPISAIRFMADQGQRSDPALANYSPQGIPLVPGYIELVESGDPLAGPMEEHVGKIKLYAWKGPDYIEIPETDVAGVDWILAENWWPYQRPSFITPPFAGYISGHSTFSRAAAEVMTLLTGDPYFPGGLGEFHAPANEFLVFEDGPSMDITLQWATYRDASDQTSLSRIWGGIHPPVDDIPGRLIGERIGVDAFALAERYFAGERVVNVERPSGSKELSVYPSPVRQGQSLRVEWPTGASSRGVEVFNALGQRVYHSQEKSGRQQLDVPTDELAPGVYFIRTILNKETRVTDSFIVLQ